MTIEPRSTDAVLGGGRSPKRTAKYTAALATAGLADITDNLANQQYLYNALNQSGYYWQSDSKQWIQDNTPAAPASSTVKVRVVAAASTVSKVADDMVRFYTQVADYKLVSRSEPYPRRPPEQLDSSVYLVFIADD